MDFFNSANDTTQVCLMTNKTVTVFQMPPMASAQGHCSQDWRGQQIWTGFCRVMLENSVKCRIQLVNEDKTLFAESVITDGSTYDNHLQRAYDSTRAFALVLVSDSGQKASVGVIFSERNDSFDLIGGLEEFKRSYRAEKGLDQNEVITKNAAVDLSLKDGEMITLNFKGIPTQSNVQAKPAGGGLKKLAPPPGSKKTQTVPAPQQQQQPQPDYLSQLSQSQNDQPKSNFDDLFK